MPKSMPVNTTIEIIKILDVGGLTVFIGSFVLKGFEDLLKFPVHDTLQFFASIGAVVYIVFKIISLLLDIKSKRIKNESDELDLKKKARDHEKDIEENMD